MEFWHVHWSPALLHSHPDAAVQVASVVKVVHAWLATLLRVRSEVQILKLSHKPPDEQHMSDSISATVHSLRGGLNPKHTAFAS